MASLAEVKKKIFFFCSFTGPGGSSKWWEEQSIERLALLLKVLVKLHSCFNSCKFKISTWMLNTVPPLLGVTSQVLREDR